MTHPLHCMCQAVPDYSSPSDNDDQSHPNISRQRVAQVLEPGRSEDARGRECGFSLVKPPAAARPALLHRNPAGSPGGSFGFSLQQCRLRFLGIPPACPADRSVFHYSNAGSASSESRRLVRRIVRFFTTAPGRPHTQEKPAGSSGGLFGFPLQ